MSETTPHTGWLVVGASVIGKSHKDDGLPCQDSCRYEEIENSWGIAVIADGAGSAENSYHGSTFVTQEATKIFRSIIEENQWHTKNDLPSVEGWKKIAIPNLLSLKESLKHYGEESHYSFASLACTLIVVIYSPMGFLIAHVGDGRGGYCTPEGEWKSLFKPWKGIEANSTIFMTSDIWGKERIEKYIEVSVIAETASAFTLMSDGCESHAFECSLFDKTTEKWSDPNRPYPKFFEPLVATLNRLRKEGLSSEELQQKWKIFLENGTPGLRDEPDDKTMILAIRLL